MAQGTIVVAGSLAQRPGYGGHASVFLQYLLGFKRLGWDVLFVDSLGAGMCFDEGGRPCVLEESFNLRYLRRVMDGFGLGEEYALLYDGGGRSVGVPRGQVIERTKGAAFVLNVMGFLADEEVLGCAARRVFLDIDPGFGQMWRELGLADVFRGHDDFVTIGENVGRPGCGVPTCGLKWLTTRQPVLLDFWRPRGAAGGAVFTSVASWRGPFGPVEFGQGDERRVYGLRVHEMRKFVAVPRLSGHKFELALDIDRESEGRDIRLLEDNGWSLVNPREVAHDPWAYGAYIESSVAEFAVAKNMYVQTRGGWFSDRSACYLASGRPVLTQDTGLEGLYPLDKGGLLTFSTLEEAVEGVEEISRDLPRHSRAARAIAEECFDSDKVLGALLGKLGVGG